jgi:hypothetical protein
MRHTKTIGKALRICKVDDICKWIITPYKLWSYYDFFKKCLEYVLSTKVQEVDYEDLVIKSLLTQLRHVYTILLILNDFLIITRNFQVIYSHIHLNPHDLLCFKSNLSLVWIHNRVMHEVPGLGGVRTASFGIIGHQSCNWEWKILVIEITGTQN